MLLLIIFAFLGGVVTILSPCILPILPIILSGSVGGGKRKPFGIITGFIVSFTFFTLFLTGIVRALGIPADILRSISVFVIFLFGLTLLIPVIQKRTEVLFSKLSRFTPKSSGGDGFGSGVIIGLSLGLLWTPCVGPILASVISLALTGEVTGSAFVITLSYSLGTSIPMFAILYGGRSLLNKNRWLLENSEKIQKIFGIVMIVTAMGIYFNYDRKFQAYILEKFPNYGTGLTFLEDNELVRNQLDGENERGDEISNMKNMPHLYPDAPELIAGGEWYNLEQNDLGDLPGSTNKSEAIRSLSGKVVLIDFWTYTCINCIRTLPYLRDWHESYKDQGLVILGIHTPEFEFEKDPNNVSQAIEDFELEYVVMQDNEYRTWRNYNNRYWPAKYLIDRSGKIRYTHFGEGKYDETEKMIQDLLSETGEKVEKEIDNPDYEIASKTPELYLGYGRMQHLSPQQKVVKDSLSEYNAPQDLGQNSFSFDGDWTVNKERSVAKEGSVLKLRYFSKDVFLVMNADESTDVEVLLDGELVSLENSGVDVENGIVTVEKDRLYELINEDQTEWRMLELRFNGEVEVYAFTFG